LLHRLTLKEFYRMATQYSTMFEAPASHEATHYNNPYTSPEFEDEWEAHEATHYNNPYTSPEFEDEWEAHEAHYNNPYTSPEFEDEWEAHEAHYNNPYTSPELEDEWEAHEAHYNNPYTSPELEDEWEAHEAHYNNPYTSPELEDEWEAHEAHYNNPYSNSEDEGEFFFKKLKRGLGKGFKSLLKAAAPLAKRFAPILAGKLAGMIPGLGLALGPVAAKLTSHLLKEGEMEAMQMEAEFFGTNEMEAEVGSTESAHDAALTEFLAAQAAEASTEAEAEATIGATLPITITIMGGRRALRKVMPVLAQANATMVKTLAQQGPTGRQLLRLAPTVQRRAIGTLKAAARAGKPINSATAAKAMASAAFRVLNNPKTVQKAIVRNAVLRQRTAPPNPRRAAAGAEMRSCPICAQRAQQRRAAMAR
jgi:hypothetical protein